MASTDQAAERALAVEFGGEYEIIRTQAQSDPAFAALVARHHALFDDIAKLGMTPDNEAVRAQLSKQRAEIISSILDQIIEVEEDNE